MLTLEQKQLIQEKAKAIRVHIVKSVTAAKSGHPGGSLSIADVMSLLYFQEMNVNPNEPKDPNRDRFVLSKGHAAPALYATLAEKGFFPTEELLNLRKIDGASYRVYSVLGDGELEEGQVWEAAMFAAHYKLSNLTAFVDFNGLQIDGDITKVMSPLPIDEKFKAFGWHVIVVDGHDLDALHAAVTEAKATTDKPTMVIMNTVKGKGVQAMEGQAGWHGKAPSQEECDQFVAELLEV